MFTLDPSTLAMLSGLIVPLLVGVVTKKVAGRGLKATLLALLSAVAGILATATGEAGLVSEASLRLGINSFVVSVATYYGLWKPTGVSEKVQDATAEVGVGGNIQVK